MAQVTKEQVEALMTVGNQPDPSLVQRMAVAAPIMAALEQDADIPDGLLDLLTPDARRTALMLLCAMSLDQITVQK